ncbi:MAG: 50S ribosomal protein L20 [Acetothermia bacterium 64_32]|nr:MAG: 50S ribosomal protein L20 [Acetothermia bacterium 64_32]MBC7098039.1 50S ribosomal protein L20 [Candidatus Bipolaricaulota bacterium]HAF70653.1 50S ribosomal protein L20 [Candidatus Acetothermia bacterium]
MRVPGGVKHAKRRRKVLRLAKGFKGKRKSCYRIAKQAVVKALVHQYTSRRLRKRDMRRLWIIRIGAAARGQGLSYSKFMGGLRKAGVGLNRKVLADLAVHDPEAFSQLAKVAREAIGA